MAEDEKFSTAGSHASYESGGVTTSPKMNENDTTTSNANEGQAVGARAAQAWDTTKEKAEEALQTTERYVQEHPRTSVLGVFGAGLLLGLYIGWSIAHEEREDYTTSTREFLKRWGHKLHIN